MSSFTGTSARPAKLMVKAIQIQGEGQALNPLILMMITENYIFIHPVPQSLIYLPHLQTVSLLSTHGSIDPATGQLLFEIDPTSPILTVIVDNHPKQACFRSARTLL